jgi:hypothetical protein
VASMAREVAWPAWIGRGCGQNGQGRGVPSKDREGVWPAWLERGRGQIGWRGGVTNMAGGRGCDQYVWGEAVWATG